MASEVSDGPTQKKARIGNVAYPNFRPEGYEFKNVDQRSTSSSKKPTGPSVEHDASPVLHLRSLSAKVVEVDIWNELSKYGKVVNAFMIKQTGQALVEFDSVDIATLVVNRSKSNPIKISGSAVQFSFSKSQKIIVPSKSDAGIERTEHNVLLLSIQNVCYPITVEVLYTICKPLGEVARIVIFRKGGVQAMVEFAQVADAVEAKKNLNGTFIYAGCCGLRVDYAKPDKLTVKNNTKDSWDFTPEGLGNASGGDKADDEPRVLLPNPTPEFPNGEPSWGMGPGMGMGGYGKDNGLMGSGPTGANGGGGGGSGSGGSKSLLGGWGYPPPPPPPGRMDDGVNSDSFGYGSSFQSSKYGSFAEGYGAGYGAGSGGDSHASNPGGYVGYGTYPPNFPPSMPFDNQAGTSTAKANETPNCVLMLYGLSPTMNCDKLFNIVCLYGNVVRIKFLRSKDDAAMVQMGDPQGCEEVKEHLDTLSVFGSALRVTHSKQPYVTEVNNGGILTDGSPIIKDFAGNKCNRFLTVDPKGGKRYPAHTIIHYYNAPPGFNEDDIKQAIEEHGAILPDVVKVLGSKNGKNSSGLLQWVKQSDANDAMCLCNHMKLDELTANITTSRRPMSFTLKLCFSSVPLIG